MGVSDKPECRVTLPDLRRDTIDRGYWTIPDAKGTTCFLEQMGLQRMDVIPPLAVRKPRGVTFFSCGHKDPTAIQSVVQSYSCPKEDYTGDRGKNQFGGLHFRRKCAC